LGKGSFDPRGQEIAGLIERYLGARLLFWYLVDSGLMIGEIQGFRGIYILLKKIRKKCPLGHSGI
jgi:hypothetical protein